VAPGVEKFVLVCVMFVLFAILVLLANCTQLPEELLHHVAFVISPSGSVQVTYNLGGMHIPVDVFVGDGPDWLGGRL